MTTHSARLKTQPAPIHVGSRKLSTVGMIHLVVLLLCLGLPAMFSLGMADHFALPKVSLLYLGCAMLLIAFVGRIEVVRSLVLPASITLPLLLLAAFLAMATALSISPATSFFGAYSRYQGLLTLLAYGVLLLGSAIVVRTEQRAGHVIVALLLGSLPVLAYGLIQRAGWDPISWSASDGRIAATMGHPNLLAAYVAMLAPIAVALFAARSSVRPIPLLLILWSLAASAVLISTGSRAGILATSVGVGFVVLMASSVWTRRRSQPILIAAGVGLLVFMIAGGLMLTRAGAELTWLTDRLNARSIQARVEMTRSTAAMIRANWLHGVGPDAYALAFPQFRTPTYAATEGLNVTPTKAHNEFLQIAATVGMPALFASLWFLVSIWLLVWNTVRQQAGNGRRWLLIGLAGGWLAYLVQVAFGFAEVASTALFAVITGALLGLTAKQRPLNDTTPAPGWVRWPAPRHPSGPPASRSPDWPR